MAQSQLDIAGVTLEQNDIGVLLSYGWFSAKQITAADAMRIRDWLNGAYPVKLCECAKPAAASR